MLRNTLFATLLLLILATLAPAAPALAQTGTVSGTVTGALSGQPVEGFIVGALEAAAGI